jgi:hypothetical protein
MPNTFEQTLIYRELERQLPGLASAPSDLMGSFTSLCAAIRAEGKYIVALFPEYTPHDWDDHICRLFALGDRLLGEANYQKLTPAELALLGFGLVAHDWGMAVSGPELDVLKGKSPPSDSVALLQGEPGRAQRAVQALITQGVSEGDAWRDYLRSSSGLRSGARLRRSLASVGSVFSEAVAKIAEGHTFDTAEIRNPRMFPVNMSVFGETVNLAALATYVRVIDLLDIGEDRTPYALWRFVAPRDPVSKMHWDRHRALSAVSVRDTDRFRRVIVTGSTQSADIYAALADLQAWIESQFEESIATLRVTPGNYDLGLDSKIDWTIHAIGFEPIKVRFELDRDRVLSLLGSELYDRDPLAFVRELLQNSVDAIDARDAVLNHAGATLRGEITLRLVTTESGLVIEWQDNGIGMDEEVLRSFFCVIGRSWYASREARQIGRLDAISQFGIGMLACFAISDGLYLETRREPNFADSRFGLKVDVPSQSSHFRIQRTDELPIGTLVRLKVRREHSEQISKGSVSAALRRIARFVRHRITIDSDGVLSHVESLAAVDAGSADRKVASDLAIGVRGDTAEILRASTEEVQIELDAKGDYNGLYRVLIPKDPATAEAAVSHSAWFLGGKEIEFDNVVLQTEQAIFLKGVKAGPVTSQRPYLSREIGEGTAGLLEHSGWPPRTLLLNLVRPSLATVNLARSTIRPTGDDIGNAIGSEIARKLAPQFYGGISKEPARNALVLGSLSYFGGVKKSAIQLLIAIEETPMLVLSPQDGLIWMTLSEVTKSGTFLEAPFEMAFAWEKQDRQQQLVEGWKCRWSGPRALVLDLHSKRQPWLPRTLHLSEPALRSAGFKPSGIRAVAPPSGEQIPLICCVWTRNGCPGSDPSEMENARSISLGWDASPTLAKFEGPLASFAGFGSRYWNREHAKVKAVVPVLEQLQQRVENREVPDEIDRTYRYFTSNSYFGYTVPCRSSGATLALTLPNRLLDLADKLGIPCASRLQISDFFPGTVGIYNNPYHYSLKEWFTSSTDIGTDWVPDV